MPVPPLATRALVAAAVAAVGYAASTAWLGAGGALPAGIAFSRRVADNASACRVAVHSEYPFHFVSIVVKGGGGWGMAACVQGASNLPPSACKPRHPLPTVPPNLSLQEALASLAWDFQAAGCQVDVFMHSEDEFDFKVGSRRQQAQADHHSSNSSFALRRA